MEACRRPHPARRGCGEGAARRGCGAARRLVGLRETDGRVGVVAHVLEVLLIVRALHVGADHADVEVARDERHGALAPLARRSEAHPVVPVLEREAWRELEPQLAAEHPAEAREEVGAEEARGIARLHETLEAVVVPARHAPQRRVRAQQPRGLCEEAHEVGREDLRGMGAAWACVACTSQGGRALVRAGVRVGSGREWAGVGGRTMSSSSTMAWECFCSSSTRSSAHL